MAEALVTLWLFALVLAIGAGVEQGTRPKDTGTRD